MKRLLASAYLADSGLPRLLREAVLGGVPDEQRLPLALSGPRHGVVPARTRLQL